MIRKMNPPYSSDPYDRPNNNTQHVQVLIQGASEFEPDRQLQVSHLRFSRRKLTFAITAFVLGGILILMESPIRNEFLAPGPLHSSHAQILAGQGADRCSACHDSGHLGFSEWISRAFKRNNDAATCQSGLCMKCHEKSLNRQFARKPHNLDPAKLANISQRFRTVASNDLLASPMDETGNIECGTCHREHHGNEDLKALTDQQCQTCHAQQYHGFEDNHPEFSKWPQQRRQRIAFDHVSHFYKHFPGQNKSFDCKTCHVDDQFQSVKLLASYEKSCSECHAKDIHGASEEGVLLVRLPMLDLDAIAVQNLSIGDWPTMATGDFDGPIPELTKMLLFKDKPARLILERRGAGFEFGDFDPEIADDVKDAVALAWAMKYLLHDLALNGSAEIRDRIEFALQRSISETEYLQLTRGLDANVFAAAANRWLPQLAFEVPRHRQQNPSLAKMVQSQKLLQYFRDEDPGLLVENPISRLLETTTIDPVGRETSNGTDGKTAGEQSQSGNSGNRGREEPELFFGPVNRPTVDNQYREQNEAEHKAPVSSLGPSTPPIPDSELLAENPLSALADTVGQQADTTNNVKPLAQPGEQDSAIAQQQETNRVPQRDETSIEWLADNPISQHDTMADSEGPSQILSARENSNSNDAGQEKPLDVVEHHFDDNPERIAREFSERIEAAKSRQPENPKGSFEIDMKLERDERFVGNHQGAGWFRNDRSFQISYVPNGHADSFLTAIMDVVAETPNSDQNPATSSFFERMTSKSAVGSCHHCHTVDLSDDGRHQINWQPIYRDPTLRSFTRFSHGPHLTQPELRDCTFCHSMDPELANAHTFVGFDSANATSNFAAITRSDCASCHFKGSTNSGCTHCHNYHVGSRVLIRQ